MISVKRFVSLKIDMDVWDSLPDKSCGYHMFEELSLLTRIRNTLKECKNDIR